MSVLTLWSFIVLSSQFYYCCFKPSITLSSLSYSFVKNYSYGVFYCNSDVRSLYLHQIELWDQVAKSLGFVRGIRI